MSEPNRDKAARPSLFLLIIMTALGPMALNMFMPSMPGMQAVFDVEYDAVQLTLTFYLAALALSQLIYGPISDRFGRRPVVIAGLSLFIVGTAMCTFAWSIESLIFGRIVQGAGGASGLVLGRAMIRDVFSREKSASMLGYVTMAMVLAPMFAPLIGGLLDVRFGWQAGFTVLLIAGLAVLTLVVLRLPETNWNRSTEAGFAPLLKSSKVLLCSPVFLSYVACMSFASAGFFAFLAAAPVIVIDIIGLTPADYGRYFTMTAGGYMFGNFISGRLSEKVGPDRMIAIGCVVGLFGAISMLAIALTGTLTALALFGPLSFVAIGNGLVLPNATAAAVSVRPDLAGAGAGIAGSSQLGVGAVTTVIVTAWTNGTQFPLIYSVMIALTLSIIGYVLAQYSARKIAPVTP